MEKRLSPPESFTEAKPQVQPRSGWVPWLFAVLAFGVAAAGQAARLQPSLDLVNWAAPLWTGAALILSVAVFRRAAWGAAALAGVAAAMGLQLCAPDWIGAVGQTRSRPLVETIRLVQFNVWGLNADPERTRRWLLETNADFIVLQEASATNPRIWEPLLAAYPYAGPCTPAQGCPIVILSRRPPSAQGRFANSQPAVESGGWMRFGSAAGAFTVASAHAPRAPGPRRRKLDELARQMAAMDRESLIFAGDLNAPPATLALNRFDQAIGIDRLTHALASWPSSDWLGGRWPIMPLFPIDHVYAGSEWKPVRIARGPSIGSDHLPIVVTLTRDAATAPLSPGPPRHCR